MLGIFNFRFDIIGPYTVLLWEEIQFLSWVSPS